ncbi:MAG TPA: hypothetical protein VM638_04575 [Actinomycetota bacterium]|nr:hypothetical protein [Actinomycetota bacterium]
MRVWGAVGDLLVEVVARRSEDGFRVQRSREARDRLRSAPVCSGLVREGPAVDLRLVPPVGSPLLDLPLALAALGAAGRLEEAGWVFAHGRLGPDGTVYDGREAAGTLKDAVEACSGDPLSPSLRAGTIGS